MKNNVDIYIYITSKTVQQATIGIIAQLKQLAGVSSVNTGNKTRNVVAVKYDPDKITAVKLLNAVKGNGVTAALVGL